MNIKFVIEYTREDFIKYVGREPEDGDLERANCDKAGKDIGHCNCGVCVHMKPVFACSECFRCSCEQMSKPYEQKRYLLVNNSYQMINYIFRTLGH